MPEQNINSQTHPFLRRVAKIAMIVVIIFACFLVLGNYLPSIYQYFAERAYEKEQKRVEATYRADTYGGKTPEETFDMFLDALKKGDVDLASKYYELGVQGRALTGLKKRVVEGNGLEKRISFLSAIRKEGEKKCNSDTDSCVFTRTYITEKDETFPIEGTNDELLIPKGGSIEESISFSRNEYTQVWKITQPY